MYLIERVDYATEGGLVLLDDAINNIKIEIAENEEAVTLFRRLLNGDARNGSYRTECKEIILYHTKQGERLCKELKRLESLLSSYSTKLSKEQNADHSEQAQSSQLV